MSIEAEDYEAAVTRYDRIVAARDGTPPQTLQEIADREDISRERVRQILKRGRPLRNGRPPAPTRRADLQARIDSWLERRALSMDLGKGTTYIDERIDALYRELEKA